MGKTCIIDFVQEIEERFGEKVNDILCRAANLDYSLDEIEMIVCVYTKHTSDAFINENAFLNDCHKLGLLAILLKIKEITAVVQRELRP